MAGIFPPPPPPEIPEQAAAYFSAIGDADTEPIDGTLLASILDLTLAAGNYYVEIFLPYTAGSSSDAKVSVVASAGTLILQTQGVNPPASTETYTSSDEVTVNASGNANLLGIWFKGTYLAPAGGTLTLKAAENADGATDLIARAGHYILAFPLG